MTRRRIMVAVPLWLLIAATAHADASASAARAASIVVRPRVSAADAPIHIRVRGLHPLSVARVRLSARDRTGAQWHSQATFRVGRQGSLDLDRARSLRGSYSGVWGAGLLPTMTRPVERNPGFASFLWPRNAAVRFDVEVAAGRRVLARATFKRTATSSSVIEEDETLATDGFVGRYDAPATATSRPAVLIFGGSEGGLSFQLTAAVLAARGFPTLSLAYWKEPGLPSALSNVPLEYFANALRWLRRQPQADSNRVVVIGVSRGSEAALLLGAYYPDLVDAVVASVPSNVALCSFPGCDGPAWTLNGKPVPYTRQPNNPTPSDDPAAVIPVERIHGPVFLDCAGLDGAWISCPYSDAIMSRLAAFHHPYHDVLFRYPRASHFVGSLLPYQPLAPRSIFRLVNFDTDERAREALWPHLLAFLRGVPAHRAVRAG